MHRDTFYSDKETKELGRPLQRPPAPAPSSWLSGLGRCCCPAVVPTEPPTRLELALAAGGGEGRSCPSPHDSLTSHRSGPAAERRGNPPCPVQPPPCPVTRPRGPGTCSLWLHHGPARGWRGRPRARLVLNPCPSR